MEHIVKRLERIFPHLRLYYEGEYYEIEVPSGKKLSHLEELKSQEGYDFSVPCEYTWYDIIKVLNENGLDIKKK